MRNCPPIDEIRQYLHANDSAIDPHLIAAHLEGCRRCAALAADLIEEDPLLNELRDAERARDRAGPTLRKLETRLSTTLGGKI